MEEERERMCVGGVSKGRSEEEVDGGPEGGEDSEGDQRGESILQRYCLFFYSMSTQYMGIWSLLLCVSSIITSY